MKYPSVVLVTDHRKQFPLPYYCSFLEVISDASAAQRRFGFAQIHVPQEERNKWHNYNNNNNHHKTLDKAELSYGRPRGVVKDVNYFTQIKTNKEM